MRKMVEAEVEQEVESDGEKTLKERCACPWMGWLLKTSAKGLSHVECDVSGIKQCNSRPHAGVLNAAICTSLRASRYARCCPQWSRRCWKCACSRTHFSVAICHSHLFVNFCTWRYCIYISHHLSVSWGGPDESFFFLTLTLFLRGIAGLHRNFKIFSTILMVSFVFSIMRVVK